MLTLRLTQSATDPAIADEVTRRLGEIGSELFRGVFQSGDEARDLWATLRRDLDAVRVEVLTDVADATADPWELLMRPRRHRGALGRRSPAPLV